MFQVKLITFAMSLMFNTASVPDIPHNRHIQINFTTTTMEASRSWSRFNNVNSNGEKLRLSYKTWKGTNTEIEHFRNNGTDINIQTIRTRYWIFGNEVVYENWFQGSPKYLYWLGWKHEFQNLTFGLSYSTDFETERFSKSNMEFNYYQKLKGNWYIKPIFERKTITHGEEDKSDWRFLISMEWRRKR